MMVKLDDGETKEGLVALIGKNTKMTESTLHVFSKLVFDLWEAKD